MITAKEAQARYQDPNKALLDRIEKEIVEASIISDHCLFTSDTALPERVLGIIAEAGYTCELTKKPDKFDRFSDYTFVYRISWKNEANSQDAAETHIFR